MHILKRLAAAAIVPVVVLDNVKDAKIGRAHV